jgi:hypothetical protein
MLPRLAALCLLCLPCCLLLWPAAAQAQVKRCTLPDGNAIYTDRQCADIGARERLPTAPASAPGATVQRRSVCAPNPQALADDMAMALQSGDANRVAALYDWTGAGSSTANAMMDRLQLLAERTTVDVQLQYSAANTPDAITNNSPSSAPQRFDERTGQLLAQAPGNGAGSNTRRLLGLQISQAQKNGYTAVTTRIGLHRRMDCWWLSL